MRQLFASIASMFRALIMLAILGGGGYLAIEHTPVLEIARSKFAEWQNRHPEHEWGGGAAPSFNGGGEAPQQMAGHGSHQGRTDAWPAVNPRAGNDPSTGVESGSNDKAFAARQVDYLEPAEPATGKPATGEWEYSALERRLRQMGVNYSMLESSGQEGGSFRFLCRVNLPGGSTKYRKFEAVGREPLDAMRQVVAKVEQWRSYNDVSRP